jgi:lipoate-protein ligase A
MIEDMVNVEWRLLELSEGNPLSQTVLDEVITGQVAAGKSPPTIRFWSVSRPSISIGKNQDLKSDVNTVTAYEESLDIVRRASGGGSDFLSTDDICYSVIIPAGLLEHSSINLDKNYRHIYDKIEKALNKLGIESWFELPCNIMAGTKKIGNMAQFTPAGVVLVHGKIRYSLPLERTLRHFICKECPETHSLLLHKKVFAEAMTCVAEYKVPQKKLYDALKKYLLEGLRYRAGNLSDEERSLLSEKEKECNSVDWVLGKNVKGLKSYGFCDEHLNGVPVITLYPKVKV